MKQKLSKLASPPSIAKVIALLFIILGICAVVLFFIVEFVSFPLARTPAVPEFTFENLGPCLEPSGDIVERFKVGDQQYICADLKTGKLNVFLELYVFTSDKKKQVYVGGGTFKSGPISFIIYPPLPPGRYWAKIVWSRPALIDFQFEVLDR